MRTISMQEEQAIRRRELSYIDDYPDLERYHRQPFRGYLDRLNADYLVKRKTALRQVNGKTEALAYQQQVREAVRASIGPLPEDAGGSAHVTGTLDQGRYLIDKVRIETTPGLFASGNFYYPKISAGPLPGLLLLCGHSNEGKAYDAYVSFCVEAVLNGFCVLTFDPIGQGERRLPQAGGSAETGTGSGSGEWLDPVEAHCFLDQKLSLLGEHLGAYMMRDNIAALTYLLARPEVDAERVGVTGNSGGGTMSAYMGAYDDRVKAVAPCCYITELRSMLYRIMAQDAEQCLPGFMQRGLDHGDLVTAAAPRPYHIGSAMFDFFPIDGVRDAFIEAKKLYRLLDAEEQVELHTVMKGHGFWQDMREEVLRFFCRAFQVAFVPEKDIDYERLPSEAELLCGPAGDGASALGTAGNTPGGSLLELIRERLEALPDKPKQEDVRERLRSLLQLQPEEESQGDRAHGGDIQAGSGKLKGAPLQQAQIGRLGKHPQQQAQAAPLEPDGNGGIAYESEEGMIITGTLRRFTDSKELQRICLAIGGMEDAALQQFREDGYDAVAVVHPRGTGPSALTPDCTFGLFDPEMASGYNVRMLGRSLQGMRVADALAAIGSLQRTPGWERAEVTLYGQEEHALTALYAAVLSRVHGLHAEGLLASFRAFAEAEEHRYEAGIIVPGLLLAFDIHELQEAVESGKVIVKNWLDPMKRPAIPRHGGS
ncbi:prolyl oligopeptidase family serine peptidase [Paenibacillus rhizovicinus]|uniref:Prolyl oligopeptidase family serine peptidase n=1 Tax=Paenibacillus rhizovicinus TaxID=2704463 RepID=A0A6C0NYW1_9BACL|nr:prolyl oligopeptidase family serine peptidase [Paenibacillus rhizovicinus]QHW31425.1 prolyl oligopeptidase family serine peptidase [Paenibacillus rhizovicinus]